MRGFQRLLILPFVIDSLALVLSGLLAYLFRTSGSFVVDPYLLNPSQYGILLSAALILWHFLLAANGGYSTRLHLFRIDELLIHFKTSMLLVVLLMAGTFLYHQYDYSRLIILLAWLIFVFLGSFGRQVSHRVREALYRRGIGRRRALFRGDGGKRGLFESRVKENPSLGIELAILPEDMPLADLVAQEELDEVYLFDDNVPYEQIWSLRERSKNPWLVVHLVPSFGNLYLRNLRGGFFDGAVMISLYSPASRRLSLMVKRCLDTGISAVFLLLLSPLLMLIALLVKLDSSGAAFFQQQRVGLNGTLFSIMKFRTMFADAEQYAETPTDRSDPRITRLGSFLRSTGLDELPQLWNVFRGDMSMVGPRPEMPFIVEKYSPLERQRLGMRPGITGLWQVYARSSLLPIHNHIEFDLYYIENYSLFLDAMVVLDTIPTMILRTGI